MNIIYYIVATATGLFFSYVGVVFSMLGDTRFTYLVIGMLVAAHIGAFVFVRKKAIQGKGRSAAIVLALPLFVVMAVMQIFVAGEYAVSFIWPDSPAFKAECETVGARYYKLPESPVHSIAYAWQYKHEHIYNYFTLTSGTRAESLQFRNYPHPATIEFTERAYLSKLPGTYIRAPRQGAHYGIDALTADALVEYQVTPAEELAKSATGQGMIRYDVTVTDRRNGEKLAFLRYVVDAKKRRACGPTENNVMDERAFVLKAIGVQ